MKLELVVLFCLGCIVKEAVDRIDIELVGVKKTGARIELGSVIAVGDFNLSAAFGVDDPSVFGYFAKH